MCPSLDFLYPRKKLLLIAVIFVAFALLLYGRTLPYGFVDWDDGLLITGNLTVQEFTFSSIGKAFTSYDPELYIPLTFVSYQLNHVIVGLSPWIYHLTNILLHAANAFLVMLLVSRLAKNSSAGLIAGLLFLVHPLHTEAAVWASARKDVLSAFFFLLSLHAYLKLHADGHRRDGFLALFWYLCALLSKVTVILLPFVLLLLDWYQGRPLDRKNLQGKIPYFALSIVFGIVAWFGKITSSAFYWEKFLIGCKAIMFYLIKLVVPIHLSVLYPYTQPISIATTDLFLSVIGVIGLSILVWTYRRYRFLVFAWIFFLLTVLPTLSNIAKGHDELLDVYFGSDRYAYLPSIGVLFLASIGLAAMYRRWKWPAITLITAMVLIFSILSFRQAAVWKSTESLFANVIRYYPNSHVAHTNLGTEYFRKDQIGKAMSEYQKAIAIRPDGTAYYNIGQIYLMRERYDEAAEMFRQAIVANPADPDSYIYLGAVLIKTDKSNEAVPVLLEALTVNDRLPQIYINLGLAYERIGKREEALESLRSALQLDATNEEVLATIEAIKQDMNR